MTLENSSLPKQVTVTAPARLHLGFLDLEGGLGRKYASLGITLDTIYTQLTCTRAVTATSTASGPSAERALKVLHELTEHLAIPHPIQLTIHQAIPEHVGLGSGTQMSLAVGLAVNALLDLKQTPRSIAALSERGARSGIGVAAFENGGVILDGGRGPGTEVPPVLSRLPWPESWSIILIADDEHVGLSGAEEVAGFKTLPPFPTELAGHLCRLMVMQILPSLAEQHFSAFAQGITDLQNRMGDHFSQAQGGRYTSQRVAAVLQDFAGQRLQGYGQSSWGPTGFLVIEDAEKAQNVLRTLASGRYSPLRFILCRGQNTGGTVRFY